MKIPKSFKVGKTRYRVVPIPVDDFPSSVGSVSYSAGVVTIAQRHNVTGRKQSPKQQRHTFWHETVHAMLYDMGSRKHADEVFVDALAKRICGVIDSARF